MKIIRKNGEEEVMVNQVQIGHYRRFMLLHFLSELSSSYLFLAQYLKYLLFSISIIYMGLPIIKNLSYPYSNQFVE